MTPDNTIISEIFRWQLLKRKIRKKETCQNRQYRSIQSQSSEKWQSWIPQWSQYQKWSDPHCDSLGLIFSHNGIENYQQAKTNNSKQLLFYYAHLFITAGQFKCATHWHHQYLIWPLPTTSLQWATFIADAIFFYVHDSLYRSPSRRSSFSGRSAWFLSLRNKSPWCIIQVHRLPRSISD